MTLQERISALTIAIAEQIKSLKTAVGTQTLNTEAKDLTGALNEVSQKVNTVYNQEKFQESQLYMNLLQADSDNGLRVGALDSLTTDVKTSAVDAINELDAKLDAITASGSTSINDAVPSDSTAYSGAKVEAIKTELSQTITDAVAQAKADLTDGADAAMDTFKEVQTAMEQDKTAAQALATSVAARLKIDEIHQLTSKQKTNVETSLNLGDTDTDFVAVFNAGLTGVQ